VDILKKRVEQYISGLSISIYISWPEHQMGCIEKHPKKDIPVFQYEI